MHFHKIFQASFPVIYKSMNDKNEWIIPGIKISWKHKRSLCAFPKNSNDPIAKAHIKYCKIPRTLIKEAKKQHFFRLIVKSDSKIKTTWNIIKKRTRKVHTVECLLEEFSVTFDCVNHEILLAELHFYGISWVSEDWFRSYLTNRRQKVK